MPKRDSNFNPIGKSRGLQRNGVGIADWETVDAQSVTRAIAAAGVAGGALRFGYSQDGYCYAIGIYGDGAPYTEYLKPHESVEDTLTSICQLFADIADDKAKAAKAT